MKPDLLMKTKTSKENGDEDEIHRLTEMDVEFVSLVRAGANRQNSFLVVKTEDAGPENEGSSDSGDGPVSETESVDFSSWLNGVSDRIGPVLMDAKLSVSEMRLAESATSEENDSTEEPALSDEPSESAQGKADDPEGGGAGSVKDLLSRINDLQAEVKELRAGHEKSRRELAREKSRMRSLKKVVGAASAVPYAPVREEKQTADEPHTGTWAGDLAREAAETDGGKR